MTILHLLKLLIKISLSESDKARDCSPVRLFEEKKTWFNHAYTLLQ